VVLRHEAAGLRKRSRLCLLSLVIGLLTGCASFDMAGRRAGHAHFLATTAESRVIMTMPNRSTVAGVVDAPQVICAEPSPDVAKALASSASLATSIDAAMKKLDVQGDAAGSLAASFSRADALAQLTNRLATIQLLRDALYRACEAYANGALTDTGYSVLLSRYDDTMISMLLAELAAGNFGQPLAAINTSTSGFTATQAGNDAKESEEAEKELKAAVEAEQKKREARDTASAEVGRCNQSAGACTAEEKRKRDETLRTSNEALADAQAEVNRKLLGVSGAASAVARTSATAWAQGQGGTPGTRSSDSQTAVAHTLAEMQRKFIENIHSDALVVACVTALDRFPGEQTPLTTFCWNRLGGLVEAQGTLLQTKIDKFWKHNIQEEVRKTEELETKQAQEVTKQKALKAKELPTREDLAKRVDAVEKGHSLESKMAELEKKVEALDARIPE